MFFSATSRFSILLVAVDPPVLTAPPLLRHPTGKNLDPSVLLMLWPRAWRVSCVQDLRVVASGSSTIGEQGGIMMVVCLSGYFNQIVSSAFQKEVVLKDM